MKLADTARQYLEEQDMTKLNPDNMEERAQKQARYFVKKMMGELERILFNAQYSSDMVCGIIQSGLIEALRQVHSHAQYWGPMAREESKLAYR